MTEREHTPSVGIKQSGFVDGISAFAFRYAKSIARLRPAARAERRNRSRVLQHDSGNRRASAAGIIVPDKTPTSTDVAIADRLLGAFRAGAQKDPSASASSRSDLWTIIGDHQSRFGRLLKTGSSEELASYLCNVARHDAAIGITQGDAEYTRILADPSYREFLALMAKDKLVSLAEAVGGLPVENPEQGPWGVNLHTGQDEIASRIAERLGIDIEPPDIDGGLLKLPTSRGLFGERDANAIFTAWLVARIAADRSAHRICEIGAGSGRVAYWSQRLGLKSYTIIDLPHVNVVQGFYLLKAAPDARVRLYGEQPQAEPELTIWPHHALDELHGAEFDLVLNQDSMPEMSSETVADYLRWIRKVCAGAFLSINHESRPPYGQNLQHVSVPEVVATVGGLKLQERYPYWLRRGYVTELYAVG
jgi:hypothetical protein